MRATIFFAIASLLTGIVPSSEALTGLEIMQEQERRHERPSEESWESMHLYDKKGTKREERLMAIFSRKGSDGLDRRLIQFASPADIRGVGLLTWEQPEESEDDQWLYLPATKAVKRIAGSGKKNQFMGTDLAYEDLRQENLSAHQYDISGETVLDGKKCWVIAATPVTEKEKRDSGYSKRVLYIRQDIYYTVKTEFYGRRGRLEKVGVVQKLVNVAGEAWRGNLSVMQRVNEGTKTISVNRKRTLDEKLDDLLFTQQGLKRPIEAQ